MAVLSVHHPDIAAFINASPQGHPHLVRAVALDDAFMQFAEQSPSAARQRLQDLALAIWAGGEPSVLFTTRLQADDNLGDEERLTATNPCGEQPLPPFGACALASVDLTRVVQRPFEPDAHVAWGVLAALVHVGVRLLDNALEVTRWPLIEQAREMQRHRRIGLGMTGLGDALAMLNLRYDSPQAVQQASQWMRFIAHTAYRASVRLARERGAYPSFHAPSVLRPPRFASRLPADLRHAISRHGLRHSHLLAIAPAASISMAFADGVSNGMEPMVAPQWERSWRDPQGRSCTAVVQPLAWRLWGELKGVARDGPEGWAWLEDITPEAQLRMVAALAPHVDGGISKTVSMPEGTAPQDIEALIRLAWRLGLKGAAFFRRGSRAGVIATGTGPADAANRGPSPSCPAPGRPARGCP
jgi:ribonucleoside-diphosphate reductase alpha chain